MTKVRLILSFLYASVVFLTCVLVSPAKDARRGVKEDMRKEEGRKFVFKNVTSSFLNCIVCQCYVVTFVGLKFVFAYIHTLHITITMHSYDCRHNVFFPFHSALRSHLNICTFIKILHSVFYCAHIKPQSPNLFKMMQFQISLISCSFQSPTVFH